MYCQYINNARAWDFRLRMFVGPFRSLGISSHSKYRSFGCNRCSQCQPYTGTRSFVCNHGLFRREFSFDLWSHSRESPHCASLGLFTRCGLIAVLPAWTYLLPIRKKQAFPSMLLNLEMFPLNHQSFRTSNSFCKYHLFCVVWNLIKYIPHI